MCWCWTDARLPFKKIKNKFSSFFLFFIPLAAAGVFKCYCSNSNFKKKRLKLCAMMWRGLKLEQLHIQRITMQATRAGLFFSWCLMQFSRVDYSIYIQDAFENSTSLSSVFYNPRPLTPPPCPPNTVSSFKSGEKRDRERRGWNIRKRPHHISIIVSGHYS